MAQYISKDALVVEIERRIKRFREEKDSVSIVKTYTYKGLLSFIDTLEVKEVDLEKYLKEDIEDVFFDLNGVAVKGATHYLTVEDVKDIAKHFFELGLKAQNDNIRHSMDETPNYPCDILLVTDVNNVFLCRYMENGRPVDRETPYFHNIQNGKCWYYCNDIMNIH